MFQKGSNIATLQTIFPQLDAQKCTAILTDAKNDIQLAIDLAVATLDKAESTNSSASDIESVSQEEDDDEEQDEESCDSSASTSKDGIVGSGHIVSSVKCCSIENRIGDKVKVDGYFCKYRSDTKRRSETQGDEGLANFIRESLCLNLRFVFAEERIPCRQHLYGILETIKTGNWKIIKVGRPFRCIQADYEEPFSETKVDVRLADSSRNLWKDLVVRFAQNFVSRAGYGLYLQPIMEILNLKQIFKDAFAEHADVDISQLLVGSMPNFGTFFIRGEYITSLNESTTSRAGCVKSVRRGIAGKHRYLSWADFEHDRKLMTCRFIVQQENGVVPYSGYKLVISYDSVLSVLVETDPYRDENHNYVYLKLRHPPQLWEAVPHKNTNGTVLNVDECYEWIRVMQWPGNAQFSGCSQAALANSLWVCLGFPKSEFRYRRVNGPYGNTKFISTRKPTFDLFEILARWQCRMGCHVSFSSVMKTRRKLTEDLKITALPSFKATYTLEALVSRGSIITDQLENFNGQLNDEPFVKKVLDASKDCLSACEDTLHSALCAVDENRTISLMPFFDVVFPQKVQGFRRRILGTTGSESEAPTNCVFVRKVIVTPLKLIWLPPETIMANRVLRKFGEDNALRCVFRDSNLSKISFNNFGQGRGQRGLSLLVQQMVADALLEGLTIGARTYKFLAWSNSQMRDHGSYFYSDETIVRDENGLETNYSVEEIRRLMGNFTVCKSVPKLMSRMGQCFSQSQPTIALGDDDWSIEHDIVGGRDSTKEQKPYIFSDGAGRISEKCALEIAKSLELLYVPSCFQVRFKGFKGVLSVDPLLDIKQKEKVVFRRSQKKFDDDEESLAVLEIIKYAMPSPACLNRSLINILDQVSLKQGINLHRRLCGRINELQQTELNLLAGMMVDEKIAANMLFSRLSLPLDFNQLHDCGFTFTDEPFFRSLLVAVHRYNIRLQLCKAKILLPGTMGRTMYGVLDETGLLQYGQVFFQFSPSVKNVSKKTLSYVGPVLVSRNPCLVGGDVRLLHSVYHEELAHLRDVIVFPRYGPRPHVDEMSGGDLDGDEYTVIFDEDLLIQYNEDAMNFPKLSAPEYDSPATVCDVVDFFLKFMDQDTIGIVSNAHLVMSDRLGLFHDICNGIAEKCSTAVDFPKTGEPAEPLAVYEKSELVPDFMESVTKPMYKSKRLLGQLYRKARKVLDIVEIAGVKSFPNKIDPHLYDECLFDSNPVLMEQSRQMLKSYNAELQQLLDEYGVQDEAAAISGHCVSLKRISNMEKDDYSFYTTDKILELRYHRIYQRFRNEFFKEFGCEEDFVTFDAFGKRGMRWNALLITKAKAWYTVCYDRKFEKTNKFYSFPWIVWDLLVIPKRKVMLELKQFSPKLVNPMSLLLTKAIETISAKRASELRLLIDDFLHGPNSLVAFSRYREKYGIKFEMLAFVFDNWLSQERIYEESCLKKSHVIIILLQFLVGITHGGYVSTHFSKPFGILTEAGADLLTLEDEDLSTVFNIGELCIEFLRYLASEQFANAPYIHFRLSTFNSYPHNALFVRRTQWAPLHSIAFRTFHHLAVTGSFESLHLVPVEKNWDFGESEFPYIVPNRLFVELGMSRAEVLGLFQEWSGVEEIRCRSGRFRDINVFLSFSGSLLSRQRLRRLLLIDVERLKHCIETKMCPVEVRDGFF